MKKTKKILFAVILLLFAVLPQHIKAEDFASDEEGWRNKCSTSQGNKANEDACRRFTAYWQDKQKKLESDLNSLQSQVDSVKNDISKVSSVIQDLAKQLDTFNQNIAINEANIKTIEAQIKILDTSIAKKQKEIDKRDNIIKGRMVSEQSTLGTNMDVEIIMGSKDIVDMIRRVEGLQKITESDQREIDIIKKEKAKLDLDKREQKRLEKDAEDKKAENIKNRDAVDTVKKQQEEVLNTYRQQEADLAEKKRSVQTNINTIKNNIIPSINPDSTFTNAGFIKPVQSGYESAGTWYYPGGGVHLGMDMATSIGTPLYAPASGVVLYANNPVSSNSGYLENWSGYPQGGGNTIQMLTQVNGTTYALSFFHLSQEGFAVQPGSQVTAGQRMALTGNSGNSTGPHCHMEIINLGSMSISDAVNRFQRTADFAWGDGWGTGALNNVCSVKGPPCRERPENFYL